MDYRVVQPAAPLAAHVHCYWLLRSAEAAPPQPVFPDGFTEIIFHFGERFRRIDRDGRGELQPRGLLAGQLHGPITIAPSARAGVLGIRFRPGGVYPFLRFPQHEVAGQVLALEDFWGRLARDLEARVLEASSDRERVAVIERVLLERLPSDGRADAVDWAVARILASAGGTGVEDLCGAVGMSRRHLERRFEERVGLGPKLLSRIVRFQRALRLSSRGAASWAGIAAECGYFDQAHLVRDFREFTGRTPSLLRREGAEMAEHFAAG